MNKQMADMLDAVIAHNEWSETEAAEALGVDQSTVNRIRNGVIKRVSYELGIKISGMYSRIK